MPREGLSEQMLEGRANEGIVGGESSNQHQECTKKSPFNYYLKFLILLSLLSYMYMGTSVWVVFVHDSVVSPETRGGCCSP